MRGPAILLLALLALAASAQAQPPERDFTVRAGFGDIPTSPGDEGAGFHIVQSLRFTLAANETYEATFHLPAGRLADTACTCAQFESQQDGDTLRVSVAASEEAATHTLRVRTTSPASQAVAAEVRLPEGVATSDAVTIVYVPEGRSLRAGAQGESLACTQQACTIFWFEGAPTWFAIQPATAIDEVPVERGSDARWVFAAMGLLTGMLLWGLLVQRGVVQRRRRQQVAVAAHKEAAKAESVQVLEARKRALMAALKEVEVARMQNEIDIPTFETVKADLKRQTVTVLRAIEEAHAAEDAKAKGSAAS